MVLSDFEAFAALGVALVVFWRFCNVTSPSEGTAGSQGEGTGDAPNVPGAYREVES